MSNLVNLELDPDGAIADVPGVTAHGIHAGLKYKDPDLALVVSEPPCTAAGAFTTNEFAAPPVHLTRRHLAGPVHAIVCNSANANACTGKQGLEDAQAMAETTAQALGIAPDEVLVASTGIIGEPLPMDAIATGIHETADGLAQADPLAAAEAITTTDTHAKHAACTVEVETDGAGRSFTIGAIAKGSGMIHPNMATMLAFVATDAPIDREPLQELVQHWVQETFNMISVDGDESTNDMVLVLANGAEGGEPIEPEMPAFDAFSEGLGCVFDAMAKAIAADGEGATALLTVDVHGAASLEDARQGARAVAASNLVKAALHGQDPNWGRIVAAIGATDAHVEPDRISLAVEGNGAKVPLLAKGAPTANGALEDAEQALHAEEVTVHVDLGLGSYQARAYGCDLSREYVTINADYTT